MRQRMKMILSVLLVLTISITNTISISADIANDNKAYVDVIVNAVDSMTRQDELMDLLTLMKQMDDVESFITRFSSGFERLIGDKSGMSIADTAMLFYQNIDASLISKPDDLREALLLLAGNQDISSVLGAKSDDLAAGIKKVNDLLSLISNTVYSNLFLENKLVYDVTASRTSLVVNEAHVEGLVQVMGSIPGLPTLSSSSLKSQLSGLTTYYPDMSSNDRQLIGAFLIKYGLAQEIADPVVDPTPTTPGGSGPVGGDGATADTLDGAATVIDDETLAEAAPSFVDLDAVPWALNSIGKLAEAGVINGKGEGIFDPEGAIIRAEFAAMIVRLLDLQETGASSFMDVLQSDWFYSVVKIAADHGYVNGIGDGKYAPKLDVTREQVATILGRIMIEQGFEAMTEEEIDDVLLAKVADQKEIASWARAGVAMCYQYDIAISTESASGGSGLYFYPERAATRAEVAEMLYRISELVDTVVAVN